MTAFHSVVIVGGGGAGLRAAISIAESDPNRSVAIVSKVYPMRSHTVSAEGGAAAVIAPDDSLDEHAYDTVSGSDWLCDQDAVEAFIDEAPKELLRLEHWGCPWSRQPDGHIAVRAFGGMKKKRTWFAADKTGFHLLHTLFQKALSYPDVVRYDEWFATTLLVDDGRVRGVVAIELSTGRIETIVADAVIVCTGGCGRVFPFTTNATIKTGDGMALAYRAGAGLKDMEFVQYHPTGLPFTGILITEAARAEGGWLINKDGYRYLQDYDLGTPTPGPVLRSMELGPRDRLSQAFVHEQEKGRTIDTPDGPIVHLDLRHLGADVIDAKLPFVRELCASYQNIDPVHELVPVRPVVHYMMGGIHTDLHGATDLAGLYAAGEVACVSINGANRLGSNSLPELLVFGARAGQAAATYAATATSSGPTAAVEAQGRDEQRRLERELARHDGAGGPRPDRIADIRTGMQEAMEAGAGIYRDEHTLRTAIDRIRELKQRYAAAVIDDHSRTFNTELIATLELSGMLDVAECIVDSALRREESRGAHQRTDFPDRDDDRYLAHSLIHRQPDGEALVSYLPVTITRWPPGQRVYGR
ncbi:fumarate reductase (quinol) flavoprotein subunit [Rhodococcus maanshanensis]|uniref:fumarate reductase (quinol) flavoprotein subunit n=1 Tax=Rhodococcus maanshanensis TaxID=183556 RepID=UPI0022B51126|nr:fumarate reductase (quinol) flavoprotein subunit [Rhodococcus maanshanensis]MCZ4558395.1 fumarate reductase (quinol) flavoprotein subunit [Rhodococcus maanshanensis]